MSQDREHIELAAGSGARHRFVSLTFAVASLTYLVGMGYSQVAIPNGARTYLSSIWPLTVWFGVVWVGVWINWGRRELSRLIDRVRVGLAVAPEEYEDYATAWRRWINSVPKVALALVIPASVLLSLWALDNQSALIRWFSWDDGFGTSEPGVVTQEELVTIVLFHIPEVSAASLLAITAMCRYLRTAQSVTSRPLSPVIGLARASLSRLIAFGGLLSFAWLVAVVVVLRLIWHALVLREVSAITIAVVMSAVGLVLFAAPLVWVERALSDLKLELLAALSTQASFASGGVRSDTRQQIASLIKDAQGGRLDVHESISHERTWVVAPGSFAVGSITVVAPLLSAFFA